MHSQVRTVAALLAGIAAFALPSTALSARSATLPTFSAKLTGSGQVPPNPSKGSGTVVVTADTKTNKVCWTLSYKDLLAAPIATIIHKAPKGQTGPGVIPFGGKVIRKGCVISPSNIVRAFVRNPTGYYVSIHTKKFPDGEIAGQLSVHH
jgi:hypothetical protein